jgi:hypothetical protein
MTDFVQLSFLCFTGFGIGAVIAALFVLGYRGYKYIQKTNKNITPAIVPDGSISSNQISVPTPIISNSPLQTQTPSSITSSTKISTQKWILITVICISIIIIVCLILSACLLLFVYMLPTNSGL